MVSRAKVWSAEKSAKSLKESAALLTKRTNVAWAVAPKSSLFLRKAKFVGSGKNKKRATMVRNGKEVPIPQRSNRCLRSTTFKTLLSGAAAAVDEQLKLDAAALHTEVPGELSVAAALPVMSKPAELELEHFMAAYASTVASLAASIKDDLKLHTKVTVGAMLAACEIVNRRVFSSTGFAPGTFVVSTKPRSKAKAAKGAKAKAKEAATDV